MTLDELQRIKQWHVAHKADHPALQAWRAQLPWATRLLALPPATRLFMCHDYKAPGRDTYAWESTVAEERARNVHVHEGVSADEFVAFAQGFLADMNATHHLLGQSRIAVDGDGATGEWYFQAWHSVSSEDGGVRDLFISGRYLDTYACRDGEWRIVNRMLVTDWVKDDPGTLDFFAANPGAPRGGRAGTDPSQK